MDHDIKLGSSVWEIHKCSVDEWINSTLNDTGIYLDITDHEEISNHLFSAVFQGNKDTLFILDVEQDHTITYYLGYLKT